MIKKCSVLLITWIVLGTSWAWSQSQAARNAAAPSESKPLVLKGALLIDGTGKAPVENAVVVIAGGRIQSVGTEGSVSIPAGATVMDVKGKTIIPGLVDSHIHYRSFLAPLFLYWGVTTVGDMGNPRGWILAEREAVEQGRLVSPYIMAAGSMINGPPRPGEPLSAGEIQAVDRFLNGNNYQTYVTDEASLRAAVAEAKKEGVDAIKMYIRMTPPLLKIGAEAAHQNGLPALAHYTSASARVGLFQGTDEVLDTGLDGHIHLFGLIKATVPREIRDRIAKGENVEAAHLMDTSKFKALAEKLAAVKMFVNPTLGAEWLKFSRHREEFDRANEEFLKSPVLNVIPQESRGRYAEVYKPYRGRELEEMEEGYRKMGEFVKELVGAGGKVMAGADTGGGAQPAGLSMHVEMQLLEESGLTPMQVIQAATSWGMEAWGKLKEAGTIEAGKRADLLVLRRNPLEGIAATREIDAVIQGGRVIDREGLAKWTEAYPRPTPMQGALVNGFIKVPFIHSIKPDWVARKSGGKVEVEIRGENFNPQSLVLVNNRLTPAKFYDEHRLGVQVQAGGMPGPGVYPLVVIRPGSAGAASNVFYLVVK